MNKEFLQQIDQMAELKIDWLNCSKLDDEILICECFCVSVADIRKLCAEKQKPDLELLKSTYGLGNGCQSCLKNQDYWTNKVF